MSTEQIRASQIDFVNDSKEKKKKKAEVFNQPLNFWKNVCPYWVSTE